MAGENAAGSGDQRVVDMESRDLIAEARDFGFRRPMSVVIAARLVQSPRECVLKARRQRGQRLILRQLVLLAIDFA